MTRLAPIAAPMIAIVASGAGCAPLIVLRCLCVSFRWLVELFELDVDAHDTSVDWSSLLETVAQRLDADMEPVYSQAFPWPLRHLSVLGGRGKAVAWLALSGRGASLLRGLQALSFWRSSSS